MTYRLLRSWKDGVAQHAGTLEDYAHLADGLLAVYAATFEERFFGAARDLMDDTLAHFGESYTQRSCALQFEPDFDLDAELSSARRVTGRDDSGAHLSTEIEP